MNNKNVIFFDNYFEKYLVVLNQEWYQFFY